MDQRKQPGDETRIIGNLPNMVMEISHRAEADGSAEHLAIRLTATPDFKSALPLLDGLGGLPLAAAWQGNPFMSLWGDVMRQAMQPWLQWVGGSNPYMPFLNGPKKDSP